MPVLSFFTFITFGDGINPAGEIAGGYADSNCVFHGIVRAPYGTITPFDPAGSVFTDNSGINPVGTGSSPPSFTTAAFGTEAAYGVLSLLLQGGSEGPTFFFRTTWRLGAFLTQSIPKTSFALSQLNLHGRNEILQTPCLRSFSRRSVQFGKGRRDVTKSTGQSKFCLEAAYLSGRKSALYGRRPCELLCVHDLQTAES